MLKLGKLYARSRKACTRFKRDEDGVAAMEFAILAVPFFALLFGIIELAVIFFMGSSLESATFESARLIRTGQFTSGDEDSFKTQVCRNLHPNNTDHSSCKSRLDIEVNKLSNFSSSTAFGEDDGSPMVDEDGDGEQDPYVATAGGDTVIVVVKYKHRLTIPGKITRLSNVDGENAREITSVTAFRNEPF